MNWQEYVGLAIRTESVPVNMFGAIKVPNDNFDMEEERQMAIATYSKATRLLHAALGVCTETAELHDGHTVSNWMEEVGDILWYLAIADSTINWHEEHYHADLSKPILHHIGEVQDVLKRHIFYGAKVNIERLGRAFSAILEHCAEELVSKNFKLEEAMIANIMKLEKRYPDKFFDAKAAIHRDVDRELEHIGGDGKLLLQDTKALENIAKLQWAKLIDEDGVFVGNIWADMPQPNDLKIEVLKILGCSEATAKQLFGDAFTHCQIMVQFDVVKDGWRINVYPYTELQQAEIDAVTDAVGVDYKEQLIEEGLTPETIMETFFPLNQVTLSYQAWNAIVKSILTAQQIERMAMDLAFERAKYYRLIGAVGIARGYDAMYAAYSGRGDKLEDFSLIIMWQESGYPMTEDGLKEQLERWK
jgi:hypothetical protein